MTTPPDNYPNKICIPDKNGFKILKLKEITHLQAHGNYTLIHLVDTSKVVATGCIKEYENLLVAPKFIRIHKSFMVHVEHIKQFSADGVPYVLLQNGCRVEVSRRRKGYFLECLRKTSFKM